MNAIPCSPEVTSRASEMMQKVGLTEKAGTRAGAPRANEGIQAGHRAAQKSKATGTSHPQEMVTEPPQKEIPLRSAWGRFGVPS